MVVCQVLAGLGGVGKTQIAAALAHRLWNTGQVDLLVWITATSRNAVVTGFAEAAVRVTGRDDPNPEHGAARLLAWLSEPHQRRWLIVLDDVDNPDNLTGLWPPTTLSGNTVVTTRRRDSALLAGRRHIDVNVFTLDQAVVYLRHKLVDHPHRLDGAEQLAGDLGHLPLALAQATAYILDRCTYMTCAAYRRRLADQRRRLAELAPHALPDQYIATVAATWTLSIDRADLLAPIGVARPVLELAALLDANGIPATLFTTEAAAGYCATRLEQTVDPDDVADTMHLLHRFSLLTIDETADAVRMHNLVQRAVREAAHPDHRVGLAVAAADALLSIWPQIEHNAAQAQPLRANANALRASTGTRLWTAGDNCHPVLFKVGASLGDVGLVDAAFAYFRQLRSTAEQQLGVDHPDTLAARGQLAHWCGEAGDAAGAVAVLEELLSDEARVLGEVHPNALGTRHELARWLGETGNTSGAAVVLEQLFEDQQKALGPKHPETLITRVDWLSRVGQYVGAVEAAERLLAERLRVLGPDNLYTLSIREWLAAIQGYSGKYTAAVAALEALVVDLLRVLGPDHPYTLSTRGSLAYWRGEAGDRSGAAADFEALLADSLRILGPSHPHTIDTRRGLTRLLPPGHPLPETDRQV